MNYIGRILSGAKEFYKDLNPATLSGAIDIVVIEQPDGSLVCSPFHVRFGKLHILRSKEKVVDIEVNDQPVDIKMKLGDAGEAFFVSAASTDAVPAHLVTSPLPRPTSPESPDMEPLSIGMSAVPETSLGPPANAHAPMASDSAPASPSSDSAFDYAFGADGKPVAASGEAWSWGWGDLPAHRNSLTVAAEGEVPATAASALSIAAPSLSSKSDSDVLSLKTTVGFDVPRDGAPSDPSAQPNAGTGAPNAGTASASGTPPASAVPPNVQLAQAHSRGSWMGSIMSMLRKPEGSPTQSPAPSPLPEGAPAPSTSAPSALAPLRKPEEDLEGGVYLSELSPDQESKYFDDVFDGFGEDDEEPPLAAAERPTGEGAMAVATQGGEVARMPGVGGPAQPRPPTALARGESVETRAAVEMGSSWPPAGAMGALGNAATLSAQEGEFPLLSLCGVPADGMQPTTEAFMRDRVDFVRICGRPDLIWNPNLVVFYGGKYFSAKAALPLLVSLAAYGRALPRDVLQHLAPELRPRELARTASERRGWLWGRWSSGDDRSAPNMAAQGNSALATAQGSQPATIMGSTPPTDAVSVAMPNSLAVAGRSESEMSLQSGSYVKSLCLSSDELKSLRLQRGANTIKFSVTTKLQGTATCIASVFLWRHDAKIVISDVDGTITKSDALGHILPALRMDWTHSGVAGLYSGMKKNGYEILYLSSRAIGQANITRGFLKGVRQGEVTLPDGPVLLSPDRLLTSFTREVIRRKPEEFKIACLQSVRALFPSDPTCNPFYAGFGNRITDAISYRSVGVPEKRIFTINPQGEVKLELISSFKTSYLKLGDILDHMFPPINGTAAWARADVDDSFNNFNFWRTPLPVADVAPSTPTTPTSPMSPTSLTAAVAEHAILDDGAEVGPPSLLHHSVSVPSLLTTAAGREGV